MNIEPVKLEPVREPVKLEPVREPVKLEIPGKQWW
jgi:hypothetical protein